MNPPERTTIEDPHNPTGQRLVWQSAHQWTPPHRVQAVDASIKADQAYRLASQGVGLLWQGDFHQARQLLGALKRRLQQKAKDFETMAWPERFHRLRLQRSQMARQMGSLLIKVSKGYKLHNPRAPQADLALEAAYGISLQDKDFVLALTELNGVLSAYQWQQQGLPIDALGQTIHPRWSVFAPTRHEYLELIMRAKLPEPCRTAVDVGTGTGILAMLLAQRGVAKVTATDTNPAALGCAHDNINRLGLEGRISVLPTDLLPSGKFDLLVCNPPWLPGAASGPLEAAVYDPEHQMLRGFLSQARAHMNPAGQAWLILSDLAEHLQLRQREQLLQWIAQAGLSVIERLDTKPTHRKLANKPDPLNAVRKQEVTSLWRLCSLA